MGYNAWRILILVFLSLLLIKNSLANTAPTATSQVQYVDMNGNITLYLQAHDIDGDNLVYGIQQTPQNGSLSSISGNQVTYTPNIDFTGTDSFAFWATDGTVFSTPATISLNVNTNNFLLTFVSGTLIPTIKQVQTQQEQEYINNLRITDTSLKSCFNGSIPEGQDLYNLTQFSCQGQDLSQTNLEELGKLVSLETLTIQDSRLSDLSPLTQLKNLKHLNLAFNEIGDISALSHLTNLEYLDLSFNQINDISSLSSLNKLQELRLDANEISDITSLTNKGSLQKLCLDDNNISDLSALNSLNQLTHLGLAYNQISNISPLTNFNNITTLVLNNNNINSHSTTGIGALANLATLQHLYLHDNQITNIDKLATPGLNNLKTLNLEFNQIIDITPLSDLTQLTQLRLSHNSISDITSLTGLINLQYLDLSSNQVHNINSLTSLTNLNMQLDVRDNLLTTVKPITEMGNSFVLRTDDNCLGYLDRTSNQTSFGDHWQYPISRCDQANINDTPIAYPQELQAFQNEVINITLLGGDPENSSLTYTIITTPQQGSLNATGTLNTPILSYTPNHNYIGPDSFTFRVTDSDDNHSISATIELQIRETPIITDIALQTCLGEILPSNTELRALKAFNCNQINLSNADLSQLGSLPNLTNVSLLNANINDINALNDLGNSWLFLDLRFNDIEDISSLTNKTNLHTLGLDHNKITDLSVLNNLNKLQEIYADNNLVNGSAHLPNLGHFVSLSRLTLRGNRLIVSDIENKWQGITMQSSPTIYLESNCLSNTPSGLPNSINIDMGGTPQRPVDASGDCPAPE